MRMHVTVSLLVLLFVHAAAAAEVYLATGANGEASFSDFAMPDAVEVSLDVQPTSQARAQTVRDRLAVTLAIAEDLEVARLQREKIYAERRARAAKAAAQRVANYREPQEYRVVDVPYRYYGYPRPHPRPFPGKGPRGPMQPEPETPSIGAPLPKWPGPRGGR